MSDEQTEILKEILTEVKIINAYLLNLRLEKAGQQTTASQSSQSKAQKFDAKTKRQIAKT